MWQSLLSMVTFIMLGQHSLAQAQQIANQHQIHIRFGSIHVTFPLTIPKAGSQVGPYEIGRDFDRSVLSLFFPLLFVFLPPVGVT